MSTARRRRRLGVAVALLVGAVIVGGCSFAGSLGAREAGSKADAPVLRTKSSPVLASNGAIATSVAAPTFVATDPPTTTPPSPSQGAVRSVEVTLTYVSWDGTSGVTAGGYVGQTVEQGGTCSLTLSRGSTKVTVTHPAIPDATTTSCGSLSVPAAKVSSGTWSSVLEYSSSTSRGTSQTVSLKVP